MVQHFDVEILCGFFYLMGECFVGAAGAQVAGRMVMAEYQAYRFVLQGQFKYNSWISYGTGDTAFADNIEIIYFIGPPRRLTVPLWTQTQPNNDKSHPLVRLARGTHSTTRLRRDLAQPDLDRNFGGRVGLACRSSRHVLAAVDEQAAELRSAHRGGYRGARLAETERQAAGLLQLGKKPLGCDLGSLRLGRLELADARLHLSMP